MAPGLQIYCRGLAPPVVSTAAFANLLEAWHTMDRIGACGDRDRAAAVQRQRCSLLLVPLQEVLAATERFKEEGGNTNRASLRSSQEAGKANAVRLHSSLIALGCAAQHSGLAP